MLTRAPHHLLVDLIWQKKGIDIFDLHVALSSNAQISNLHSLQHHCNLTYNCMHYEETIEPSIGTSVILRIAVYIRN